MRSAVLSLLLLFGATAAMAHPVRKANHPALNQSFELKVGQSATVPGLPKITFKGVTEDSRCPEDVTCVWAGNAKVLLWIKRGGGAHSYVNIILNSGLNPKHTVYQGYDIKLTEVKPPRNTKTKIQPGDYVITLVVTKI